MTAFKAFQDLKNKKGFHAFLSLQTYYTKPKENKFLNAFVL